jgi:hypothetical protein
MVKRNQSQLSEAEVLARMAGNFQKQVENEKTETTPDTGTASGNHVEHLEKEKKLGDEAASGFSQSGLSLKDKDTGGNGKKNIYEEKFLKRIISGSFRSNVGISKDTLDIAERVIARLFDNKIAVSAYVDNILMEHFNKYRKDFDTWLVERPLTIF